jgi:hypothetical protein
MSLILIDDVKVHITSDSQSQLVCTTFADGAAVLARPVAEPWLRTLSHDPLHSFLASLKGLPHSKALWNVAHPYTYSDDDVAYEEASVLRIQEVLYTELCTPTSS